MNPDKEAPIKAKEDQVADLQREIQALRDKDKTFCHQCVHYHRPDPGRDPGTGERLPGQFLPQGRACAEYPSPSGPKGRMESVVMAGAGTNCPVYKPTVAPIG